MAVNRQQLFSIACVLVIATLIPAASTTECKAKKEAAGVVGDVVDFYICEVPSNETTVVGVGSGDGQFELERGTWLNNWFWEPQEFKFFHFRFNITEQTQFVTTTVVLSVADKSLSYTDDLKLRHAGRPELCRDLRNEPKPDFYLTADFFAKINTTGCVSSPDESREFVVSIARGPDEPKESSDLPSTFGVTLNADPEGSFDYTMVLDVSSMSENDVGNWTVTISNTIGALTITAHVEATGPPVLCADEKQNKTVALGEDSTTVTVCVVAPGGKTLTFGNVSKFNETTNQQVYDKAVADVFESGISKLEDFTLRHEISLTSASSSEADYGLYRLQVGAVVDANTTDWLQYDFIVAEHGDEEEEEEEVGAEDSGSTSQTLTIIIVCVVVGVVLILALVAFACYKNRDSVSGWMGSSKSDGSSRRNGNDQEAANNDPRSAEPMLTAENRNAEVNVKNPVYGQ